jgi:hypothetical protein
MKKILEWSLLSILLSFGLMAEIEQITLKWNPAVCSDICSSTLEKNFQTIKGVSNLQLDHKAGTAAMNWASGIPFSYNPFYAALHSQNLRIKDIYLRIRGNITHDTENFYIVSLGDNTRFHLIGPVQEQPGQYVIQANIATHPLSAELREKLSTAEKNKQTITIEGLLFEPTRHVNTLVINLLS